MLPKAEKISKKKIAAEQLDLVESITREDKAVRHRLYLIITLVLSVGLSVVFWLYRSLSSSSLSLPQFNLSFFSKTNTASIINLPNQYQQWSIYIKSGDLIWSQNYPQSPDETISKFDQLSPTTSSLLSQVLPSGVDVKEILATSSASYQISVPGKQIILLLSFPPGEQLLIPSLAEKIYWALISH